MCFGSGASESELSIFIYFGSGAVESELSVFVCFWSGISESETSIFICFGSCALDADFKYRRAGDASSNSTSVVGENPCESPYKETIIFNRYTCLTLRLVIYA